MTYIKRYPGGSALALALCIGLLFFYLDGGLQRWLKTPAVLAAGRPAAGPTDELTFPEYAVSVSTVSGNFLAFRHAQQNADLVAAARFAENLTDEDGYSDFVRFAISYHLLQGNLKDVDRWNKSYKPNSGRADEATAHVAIYRLARSWRDGQDFKKRYGDDSSDPIAEWVALTHDIISFWRSVEEQPKAAGRLLDEQLNAWSTEFDGRLIQVASAVATLLIDDDAVSVTGTRQRAAAADMLEKMIINLPPRLAMRVINEQEKNGKPSGKIQDQMRMTERLVLIPDNPDQDNFLSPRQKAALMLIQLGGTQLTYAPLQALMWARIALVLDPEYDAASYLAAQALTNLYQIYDHDHQRNLAISALRTIPESSPLSMAGAILMARIFESDDQTDQALSVINSLEGRFGDYPHPYVVEGDIHSGVEDFPLAIAAYTEATLRFSDTFKPLPNVYFLRAIAYEQNEQWLAAENDFKKSLEIKSNQPSVLNYLAYSWILRDKNLDKALTMLQEADRLSPNRGYIIDSIGWAFYHKGLFDEAIKNLERAVVLNPSEAEIIDHLGDAYWRVGRFREARFQWQRALEYNDNSVAEKPIQTKISDGLSRAISNALSQADR